MRSSLLALGAVLDAFIDLLILDYDVDFVRSSIVMMRSTPPLPMFLLGGWRMGHQVAGSIV